MVLEEITYFIEGKKRNIKVKICKTPMEKFIGLMFKKSSPPLLFVFNKEKNLKIHSFFCKPFKGVWLDSKMKSTKIIDIKKWKINFSGRGKYLLEIPKTTIE